MNVQVEKHENNIATLRVEIDEATVEKALNTAYNKRKKSFNVPGFRKGKVPKVMIERMYGPEVFYDDAINTMISEEYPKVYDESELDIVSQPEVEVVQMEKGKPFIFTAVVATRPEVKLGKYKGVSVTKVSTTVTKKEVDEEINRILNNHSRMEAVERKAKKGDVAVIDYEGSVDGVPFEGGKAENHNLELGSNSFIEGFEEQIIGKKAGEEFNIDVTFPKEYHSKELAGKPAVFAIKLHEVRQKVLPTLDDEFVADTTEFETVDEYKASIKDRLTENKKRRAMSEKQNEAMDKIVADADIDIPEPMLNTQLDSMINDYARSLSQQGMSMDMFLQATNSDLNGFREQMRPEAEKQLKGSLVLDAIVKAEGIEGEEADVDKRIEDMCNLYGMDVEDMKSRITPEERDRMKKDIAIEKALEFVGENAKEVAKSKKAEEGDADKKDEKKPAKKTTKKKEEE